MRSTRLLLLLLLLVLPPWLTPVQARDQDQTQPATAAAETHPEPPPAPARVIVRISRGREIAGTVQLEDESVIVIRKAGGELESFSKSRVLRIVRLVEPQPGQRGTVRLRNGQRTTGIILRDDFDRVVVDVRGIPITFKRGAVDDVVLEPTFEDRYRALKSSIGTTQYTRRLALARWLVDERRYQLAHDELASLMADREDLAGAHELMQLIRAQLALQKPAPPAVTPRSVITDPDPANAAPEPRAGLVRDRDLLPDTILTHDDVNTIRVYEIDFAHPPKVTVDADTIRTLLETYGADERMPRTADARTAMFRADPLDVVELMFELRARELYPRIRVLSEPRALNMFRQRVHNTWLMSGCSSSRCHGGPFGGRLLLHNRNYRDARVRYTNLLTLERLDLDPKWRLIDYQTPSDSLIVQAGLPRELARWPHPDVRGWKPVFTKANQPLLRNTLSWIEAMLEPRPDYPVEYDPPLPKVGETPSPQVDPAAPDRIDR